MQNTSITPANTLFEAGGVATVSKPFKVTSPTLIIAFGLKPSTNIQLEMLDMAVMPINPEEVDPCCVDACNPYPKSDELVTKNAQPVCGFKICAGSYIGKVLVAGWYRAIMSDNLSLNTAKVWTQVEKLEIVLNIPVCPPCA
jgi:hypothetical protein